MRKRRARRGYESRIIRTALFATLPLAITCIILLSSGDFRPRAWWTTAVVIGASLFMSTWLLRERLVTPLRTVSNLLAALREGDYSLRIRPTEGDDAFGELYVEANAIRDIFQERRLEAESATALVREVVATIESAIIVFDDQESLRLANRFAETLLARPAERLTGMSAKALGLDELIADERENVVEHAFPGGHGRFRISVTSFRDRGRRHKLAVISDLSRTLREEERLAWQRLVRVLGHEINNSLAPIRSIAESLGVLVVQEPLPHDWRDDVSRGLSIIAGRADALARFTTAYSRIAHLPIPQLTSLEVSSLVQAVAVTETRVTVRVEQGDPATIRGDRDQLEQALINLLKNAGDASLETGGSVSMGWRRNGAWLEITVADEGPGIAAAANLFVPFFTTKRGGTGVGLVLARQIAEAHNGALELRNRNDVQGCIATLSLPISRDAQ